MSARWRKQYKHTRERGPSARAKARAGRLVVINLRAQDSTRAVTTFHSSKVLVFDKLSKKHL